MKKGVIKRRKRVPAAPGGSPSGQDRMTDQAAAAILASVGRPHTSQAGTEESAEEAEGQPRKKRARKSKADKEKEAMEVDEESEQAAVARPANARARKGTGRGARRGSSRMSDMPSHGWPEGSVQGEAGPSTGPGQDGACCGFGLDICYLIQNLSSSWHGLPSQPSWWL